MKKYLLLATSVLMLAACSSPKYAYYFDHYDYNSGKKNVQTADVQTQNEMAKPESSPLLINEEAITASVESRMNKLNTAPLVTASAPVSVNEKALLEKKYSSLTRAEKKEFRKELKSEIKEIIKAKKSGESIKSIMEKKAMDRELKMALIFGIVAIVLGAFGPTNSVFWVLSTVALVVALVFLIMWLSRQ